MSVSADLLASLDAISHETTRMLDVLDGAERVASIRSPRSETPRAGDSRAGSGAFRLGQRSVAGGAEELALWQGSDQSEQATLLGAEKARTAGAYDTSLDIDTRQVALHF